MARRRRSSAAESLKRRKDGDESLHHVGEPDSDRRLITIFVIFFIVIPAVSIVVYKVKFADRVIQTETSIRHKGIVKTDINFQEILTVSSMVSFNVDIPLKKAENFRMNFHQFIGMNLFQEHSKASENSSTRHYDYPVLAYITPW